MAFGPYQHTPLAYQGVNDTAYQIGVIGSGVLLCGSADITGVGTVTGTGVGEPIQDNRIILYPDPIMHRR